MSVSRRQFLKGSGVGLLTFYVSGCQVSLTPEQAKQQQADFLTLTGPQVSTLEALGNVLVPGAASKGLAHFLDQQLSARGQDQLLMIRYLGVPQPFDGFYTAGLAAVESVSRAAHGKNFAELKSDQKTDLVMQMAQTNPEGWQGPPAPFFYFVVRSDAVDVVYGTTMGFDELDVPYMPHIEPPTGWRL
ncbi:MAG: gluconate 2-dehydrogenase subunit 3 family protein [Pseudomonadota bacterium]